MPCSDVTGGFEYILQVAKELLSCTRLPAVQARMQVHLAATLLVLQRQRLSNVSCQFLVTVMHSNSSSTSVARSKLVFSDRIPQVMGSSAYPLGDGNDRLLHFAHERTCLPRSDSTYCKVCLLNC